MPLDPAYNKAIDDFRKLSPYAAANAAGVVFDGRAFRIPFFNRAFGVRFPEGEVFEIGATGSSAVGATGGSPSGAGSGDRPVSLWLQIILLHYLINAGGAPIADDWITFRQLPGGYVYEKAFAGRAMEPLVQAFGSDLAGFVRAAQALGGVKMDRTGDAAYWFMAFPRLRMGCILFLADEEMPASVNILFDRAAGSYLPTEDLSAVGGYLSMGLIRGART